MKEWGQLESVGGKNAKCDGEWVASTAQRVCARMGMSLSIAISTGIFRPSGVVVPGFDAI